jgi:hypothetical protein
MKKSAILICLLLAANFVSADSAESIMITVTANVFAPNCCSVLPRVSGTTTVSVTNPTPAWHQQPIDWINSFNTSICINWPVSYDEFCCIGMGNSATIVKTANNVPCPVAAMATTHAQIGGYGILPYYSDYDQSWCEEPCADPFCF